MVRPRDLVAGFPGQTPQSLTLGAQHQCDAPIGEGWSGQRRSRRVEADAPDIRGLQRDQRAGDIHRAQQRHRLQRAGGGLGEAAGLLGCVAVLGDHGGGAERSG